jgi:hypothetical protein
MKDLRYRTFVTLLFCVACASGSQQQEMEDAEPETMAIPQSVLIKCTDVTALSSACPTQMPKVIDERRRARVFRTGASSVFFAEWSGPYPGLTPRNAPSRFVHINVIVSPLGQPLAFRWPTRRTGDLEDLGRVPKKRDEPLLVGAYTWGGRDGEVALAPSFPAGGIEGDHLIFRWIQAETAYSISLHAWEPMGESINGLRAVVESVAAE